MAVTLVQAVADDLPNNIKINDWVLTGDGSTWAYFRHDLGDLDFRSGQKLVILSSGFVRGVEIKLFAGGGGGINGVPGTGLYGEPFIITNGGGQLVCGDLILHGFKNYKVTGKFDSVRLTGHSSAQGHDDGNYGKTYGIDCSLLQIRDDFYVNIADTAAGFGTEINRASKDGEIEFVAMGEGSAFAGLQIKNDNLGDNIGFMGDYSIHDCYLHDTEGENVYIGNTSASPSDVNQGSMRLHYYNNRHVRAGVEGFQIIRLAAGSRIHNNISVLSALDWLSPFQPYQDGNGQLGFRNGDVEVYNNIFLGGGVNGFNLSMDASSNLFDNNALSGLVRNNLITHQKEKAMYIIGGNTTEQRTAEFLKNFFGLKTFRYNRIDGSTDDTDTVAGANYNDLFKFANNKYDDVNFINAAYLSGSNVSDINSASAVIDKPIFVDSGFNDATVDWTTFEKYTYLIAVAGSPNNGLAVTYPINWYVVHNDKIYQTLQEVNQTTLGAAMEPSVTVGWESYYTQLTFNGGNNLPADDYRLVANNKYNKLGIGLLDNLANDAETIYKWELAENNGGSPDLATIKEIQSAKKIEIPLKDHLKNNQWYRGSVKLRMADNEQEVSWTPSAWTQYIAPIRPILSALSSAQTGELTGSASITTNKVGGTVYWVASTRATQPTQGHIFKGVDDLGNIVEDFGSVANAVAGIQSITIDNLFPGRSYYIHSFWVDVEGKWSQVVTDATGFTTLDTQAPIVTIIPNNGAVEVLTNATITLNYDEAIRNINATEITNANSATLITLKENNAAGLDIAFTSVINVAKTVITITPTVPFGLLDVVYVSVASVEDVSGNENVGGNNATFTITDGIYNSQNALLFDGFDDYVDMGTSIHNSNTEDLTVSVWFKVDNFGHVNTILGRTADQNRRFSITNSTTFLLKHGGGEVSFTVPVMSVGVWYHVLLAYDSSIAVSNVNLWLNGVENTSGVLSLVNTSVFFFSLIGVANTNFEFEGTLDDLLIKIDYVGVLADATAIYDAGAGLDPSTVITAPNRYYKFNETGTTTIAVDSGSEGANGTLTNFPASGMWVDGFTTPIVDVTPPVETFNPANGATGTDINGVTTISYNEPIRKADGTELVNGDLAALLEYKENTTGGATIPFTATINLGKTIITITPTSPLPENQVVYVAIGIIEDNAGNETVAKNATYTAAGVAPVETFSPVDGATNTDVNGVTTITYNEAIRKIDGTELVNGDLAGLIEHKEVNNLGATIPFTAVINVGKTIITITPTSTLPNNQVVYVSISPIEDTNGNETVLKSATYTAGVAGTPAVTSLDTWSSVVRTNTLAFPVSAGTNRYLIGVVNHEDGVITQTPPTGATYGDKAMTLLLEVKGTGGYQTTQIWGLKEADIATAVGTNFVTSGANTPDIPSLGICSFTNVNQTTPVRSSGSDNAGTNPSTGAVLTINTDDMVVMSFASSGGFNTTAWFNQIATPHTGFFDDEADDPSEGIFKPYGGADTTTGTVNVTGGTNNRCPMAVVILAHS